MPKKMVIKLAMNSEKTRSKALKVAVSIKGVHSVALGDKDKNQIEVIGGDGVDPVKLTSSLRKKMVKWPRFSCFLPKSMRAYAELVSVKEEKKDDEPKKIHPIVWSYGSSLPQYNISYEDPHPCSIL